MERFADRYTLLRPLGSGGMGAVYLALDRANGRECALKRLEPGLIAAKAETLLHEFGLLSRLRHPLIVRVFDFGRAPDGTPYYTMEYVPGAPVDRVVAAGDWHQVAMMGTQIAFGLEALHAHGILHGDLKPQNILAIPAGGARPASIRLVDFGLAALLGRDAAGHGGTPGYTAPEIVRGEAPSVASDLFGLGAVLYGLGVRRGAADRSAGERSAADLAQAGAPHPLARLILRLLAPKPGERPASAREVRQELERLAPGARLPLSERLLTETVVGRERELGVLERWLALAPAGANVTILTGEPGIGRSALLGALAASAELAGRRTCHLTCGPFPGQGEFATALLERLALEGNEHAVPLEAAPVLRAQELTRRGLALGQALAQAGKHVLVLLDEAEHLDPLSRSVIRRLAFHPELPTIRWIWAFAGQSSGLPEEDQVLLASKEANLLALGPLEREAADQLLASRLLDKPPANLCQALWDRAGGHPGLLLELLKVAIEQGALKEHEGELIADSAVLSGLRLPVSLEAARLERLSRLPEPAQALARALAVLGRPAAEAELLAVAGVADRMGLDDLAGAGLCTCRSGGNWSLSPPGLGKTILQQLPQDARRSLHETVLAVGRLSDLERFTHLRGAGRNEEALASAAATLAQAPDERLAIGAAEIAEQTAPAEASRWQERAARALLERGHHLAAIPYLERALESKAAAADRPALWHLLSAALLRTGSPADVRTLIARALAEDPPAHHRGLLLCNEASALASQGDLESARHTADQALQIGRETADEELRGLAALTRGGIALAAQDLSAAAALGREAEEACARAGNELGRIRALGLRGAALAPQDLAEAGRLFTLAIAEARAGELRMAAGELLGNWAGILLEGGRWREARAAHAEAFRLALDDGRARMSAIALANLVHEDSLTGELKRAGRSTKAALRLVRCFYPSLEPFLWRTISRLRRLSGREQAARRALARARQGATRSEAAWCELEAALQEARLGRWRAAERLCVEALGRADTVDPLARVLLTVLAGRAELRSGQAARALERLHDSERALMGRTAPYFAAHVSLLAAELELQAGRLPAGLELGARTFAAFSALPAPAERAVAAIDLAALVMEGEGLPQAPVEEWLSEAIETCGRLDDHRLRERGLALEVRWLRRLARSLPERPAGNLLRSVGKLLASLTDLTELTRQAMALAVEQLGAERGVLLLAESGSLVPVVEFGVLDQDTRDRALGYSRRVVERVAHSGGSLLIADAPTDPDALSESVIDLGLRSILCVPLYAEGQVIGAVYLDDSRRAEAFSHADRKLLEGFAELVALAIEKSRGHEEIRRENELLVGENLSLRRRAGVRFQRENFIAMSAAMQEVLAVVERAAQVSSTVLVTGENGTGKELVARILHHSGKRSPNRFVVVNCGAIPESLLESELFGILPNVATGVRGREGRFVEANGGTLFLDEVGDMPLPQQVALLSVIATREVTPVGGGHPIKVDVRIIAATNRDLARRVEEGAFREDLYYRLNVIPIEIPPLRRRKADIPALAQHFAANFAAQQEREVPEFSSEFLAALMQSDWPGNVRELQNYMERVMAMTPGRVLQPRPLPHDSQPRNTRFPAEVGRRLRELVEDLERRQIEKALTRSRGIQTKAAQELGLTEQALRSRLRKYGLPDFRRFRKVRRKTM
jgi:transcriptional regulator with GAF, ATPase, and Fis domain/tetratricopeptide (TPR) repeat protein